jgi:Protein of unknown function (DUF3592)
MVPSPIEGHRGPVTTMTHVQDRPVAPSAPLAVDTAKIGPTLRRKRMWSALVVVAALVCGVAALCTYVALDNHYLAVQRTLPRYPGVITDVRDSGSEDSSGEVDVRWTQGDARWQGTVHVGNTGSWHDGQSVPVIVDPERPDFFTLPGENYKPDGLDAGFAVLGFACVGVIIWGSVWLVRTNRKVRRAAASSWVTCDAYFVAKSGDRKTLFYLPEYAAGHLWQVKGFLPRPHARVQVAGDGHGLVIRREEGADLMLAEPKFLGTPTTARVAAYDERGDRVAFRLEVGAVVHFVAGARDRLAPDIGDLEAVRAATLRLSSTVALLQLGLSKYATFLDLITEKQAETEWPRLVPRVEV